MLYTTSKLQRFVDMRQDSENVTGYAIYWRPTIRIEAFETTVELKLMTGLVHIPKTGLRGYVLLLLI